MSDPVSLRALAALIRSGLTVRQALEAWPDEVAASCRRGPLEVRRRLSLGLSVSDALAGDGGGLLEPILTLHLSAGGDVAAAVDRAATNLERQSDAERSARAASSGARLSARLVAGLPLAFLPFSPAARSAVTDPFGAAMLLIGVALSVAGLRWIGRLVPLPPAPDPVIQLSSSLATLLGSGLSVTHALTTLSSHPPPGLETALTEAAARVRLGRPWCAALETRAGLGRVARVVDRAARAGVPAAAGLEELAATLRVEQLDAFRTRVRRAPVLMVVPLTLCILPAYGLLAIGPFLRSISLG